MRFAYLSIVLVISNAGPVSIAMAQRARGERDLAVEKVSGQRWAVLVGVDEYAEATALSYCGNDMEGLRERLLAVGFPEEQVTLLTDRAKERKYQPFRANIKRQLELLLGYVDKEGKLLKPGLARAGDLVVIALSGHGVMLNDPETKKDVSYFCPAEASLDDPDTLLSLDWLYQLLEATPARHRLLMVDACRNVPRKGKGKSPELDDEAQAFAKALRDAQPKGFLMLTSCAAGERSWEEDEFKHGVFTHFFLEGFDKQAKAGEPITVAALFDYSSLKTNAHVVKKYRKNQTPMLRGDGPNFIFGEIVRQKPALLVAPFTEREIETARAAWAEYLGIPERKSIAGIEMILIPPGEFMMGSTQAEADGAYEEYKRTSKGEVKKEWFSGEVPRHRVRITEPFYVGVKEVTRGQFRRFADSADYKTEAERDGDGGWGLETKADGSRSFKQDPKFSWRNTGFEQTDSHPVVNVTWNDAKKMTDWLSGQGASCRLLTEAEWEYCCRAGSTGKYSFGDQDEKLSAHGNIMDGTYKGDGWNPTFGQPITSKDGYVFTSPSGQYLANAFGLFDMHGNVREWCSDWHGAYASEMATDPRGAYTGALRVNRGGGWNRGPVNARSAYRGRNSPAYRSDDLGFRVASSSVK